MAPRPSAVIGLRDAQTGDARATRVRQLATPSWLSTRPKPVIRRLAAPDRDARETVAQRRHQLGARQAIAEARSTGPHRVAMGLALAWSQHLDAVFRRLRRRAL